jgi:hypothetical protein
MVGVLALATSFETLRTEYAFGLFSAAFFLSVFAGVFHGNLFGMTGSAFGFDAVALDGRKAMRAYFAGSNLVIAAIAVPLSAVLLFALAVYAHHPAAGLLVLAVNLAGLGAGMAFSNLFSAVLAYRCRSVRAIRRRSRSRDTRCTPSGSAAGAWSGRRCCSPP